MSDNNSFNVGYAFYNINIEDDSKNITDNVKKIFKICFSECSKHDGTISLYSC